MAATAHGQLMKLFCKTLKIFNQTSREQMLLPHTIQVNSGKPVLWIYPIDHEHAKQVDDTLLKIKTVLCRFAVLVPARPPVTKLSDMAVYENLYDAIDQEKERDKETYRIQQEIEAQKRIKEERALQRKKKRAKSKEKIDGSSASHIPVEVRSPKFQKGIKMEIEKPKVDYKKQFLIRFLFAGTPPDEDSQNKKAFRINGKKTPKPMETPRFASYHVSCS